MKQFFKLILLISVICMAQKVSYAQKTNYQIKVYYNFLHTSSETDYGDPTLSQVRERASTNFGVVIPAFVVAKNKARHEIELSNFRINNSKNVVTAPASNGGTVAISGVRVLYIHMAVRYEFAFNLLDTKSLSGLFLGASVQPFIDYARSIPETSLSFPIRNRQLGARLHLIPRYTYDIGKRWFIDVNFPINMVVAGHDGQRVENPVLTTKQQCNGGFDTDFFNNIFQVRIGIGLKLLGQTHQIIFK